MIKRSTVLELDDDSEDSPQAPKVRIHSKFLDVKSQSKLVDSDSELEASGGSAQSGEDDLIETRPIKKHDSNSARSGTVGSFTIPKNVDASSSSWGKENNSGAKGESTSNSGWNRATARAKMAPAGPPPAAMLKRAPVGPPPTRLMEAATMVSEGDHETQPPAAHAKKPYSIADESDLDDDGEDRKNGRDGSTGDDEIGDDVIKRPILRNSFPGVPRSPFEEYAAEKKSSGVVLPRKSGRYEEDIETSKSDAATKKLAPALSFICVAHLSGTKTERVHCTIYRDRSTVHTKLYPEYQLVLDDAKTPLLLARKMSFNTTSNYHLFDLTRGLPGNRLTKKSGNYLGKLRAQNSARTEYVIVTNSAGREEIGGIVFERLTLFDQIKAGSQPRKMSVLVPPVDSNNLPIPNCPTKGDQSIATLLKTPEDGNRHGLFVLESKMPVFENGNYRLNFKGRVNLPSVKNFQLVSPADIDDVICQFGKVHDDKFHLDYKSPLNAVQAFGLALTQFNL